MIARLGVPVMLCAPLGGDTGRLLKTLIADEQVQVCSIDIAHVVWTRLSGAVGVFIGIAVIVYALR